MADATTIDPRILEFSQTQPQPQPLANSATLPSRTLDTADDSDDDGPDGNAGSEKRRKLNLYKCKQCRDARKKCLPEGREWPQKCDRCRLHRPHPLECSPAEQNTRKRGPSKQTNPAKTPSTSDRQEPRPKDNTTLKVSDTSMSDKKPIFERPGRTTVGKTIKRELPGSPAPAPVLQQPHTPKKEDYPPSVYSHMEKGEFRILTLGPGSGEEKVQGSFHTASIDRLDQENYEAVSYLWANSDGIEQPKEYIHVEDSRGQLHVKQIKRFLYAALLSLRHPTIPRQFWVDALCVNHSDVDERNRQMMLKRSIFYNAQNLCFWLGEDINSKNALNFIPRILDLTTIDKLVKDNDAIAGWVAFVALLHNPVFSRLWLVQEVAVARNVTLHSDQSAIHYGDLVDAVAMFVSLRDDILTLFRDNGKNYKELFDRKMIIAERFIDVSTNALRVTSKNKIQRLLSLEALVSLLSSLDATDPRDRIFSVLAMAKHGLPLKEESLIEDPHDPQGEQALRIDYRKTTIDVYQEFVEHAIKHSQSVNILCRHWASLASEKEELPTWVRPLQSSLQQAFDNNIPERTSADSLVGLPDHNYYNASRGRVAVTEINDQRHGHVKSLFAGGRRLDTISNLGPRALGGIIPCEWLQLGECKTISETPPENFWRTLVADRGPNGRNAPSWYARAFLYCLYHLTPTGDINTGRLIAECGAESSLVADFLQRVQSVIWNRRFLVSRDNGWIGLAPTAAQTEDIICILYGCSVPVVLRPRLEESGTYLFVGECYVDGMMDGDAVEPGVGEEDSFEIV